MRTQAAAGLASWLVVSVVRSKQWRRRPSVRPYVFAVSLSFCRARLFRRVPFATLPFIRVASKPAETCFPIAQDLQQVPDAITMRDHQATHKQAHRGADKPLQLAALRISRRSSKQLQIPAVPDDLSDDEAEVRVRPPRKSVGAGDTNYGCALGGNSHFSIFTIHEKGTPSKLDTIY